MANKTNLSSWAGLESYLTANVDKDKDWKSEDLKDYTALSNAYAAKKLTGDQFAEGKILLQQYLADAQAENTRVAAQAAAENQARKENAYSNYLNTRLSSYLGELQGNAGQKGYIGTVQGQQVAIKNAQENAFQQTEDTKRTALSDILETYQKALTDNSSTAIDQQTTLQSTRDEKYGTDLENYKSKISAWIDGDQLTEGAAKNGALSAVDTQKLSDYLAQVPDEKMRSDLQTWLDFTHGSKLQKTQTVTQPDGSVITQTAGASDNEVNAAKTKIDTDLAAFADKASYDAIKTFIDDNKSYLGNEYDTYIAKLDEKMNTYTHTKDKGYSIAGLSNTLAATDDIDITINGSKYDLVAGERKLGDDTNTKLNKFATGSDVNPATGTIVADGGNLYIFKKSRYGEEWFKIGSDKSDVSDALKAWNQYAPKYAGSTASTALQEYFAKATTAGADVKTTYKAGGEGAEKLRAVVIPEYGNKTFGEIMDAIDNSKEMPAIEKGRRRTSAYALLAKYVK